MRSTAFILLLILYAGCTADSAPSQSGENVPEDPFEVTPLLVGSSVPDVMVRNMDDRERSLVDLVSQQPTLIIFYRGGWCPYCNTHLAELSAIEDDIYDLGYQILAISPDQPGFLSESMEEQDLEYTLLSDSPMEVARAFGVAYREDDETVAQLKSSGMDVVERSGHEHQQLPVPAVFIADTSGNIQFQYANPDYQERINGEILMTALRELRE